jgi:NADH:ubiquinone oxidoreductase subunit 2 (subunit N)
VINSVISAYYYLKPVRVMFMSESDNLEPVRLTIIPTAAILIAGIIVIALGIAPQILTSFSDISGTSLLP